jgi:hypothetical protein
MARTRANGSLVCHCYLIMSEPDIIIRVAQKVPEIGFLYRNTCN